MFHAVAAAAEEVAYAAVFAVRFTHTACHRDKVGRQECFSHEFRFFFRGVTGGGGKFFIGPGLFVADQAVDIFRFGEIESIVFPSVPGVATGASRPV